MSEDHGTHVVEHLQEEGVVSLIAIQALHPLRPFQVRLERSNGRVHRRMPSPRFYPCSAGR